MKPVPDHGTPERLAKGDLRLLETAQAGVYRAQNVTPHPLDRYLQRGHITERHREAGRRLEINWRSIHPEPLRAQELTLGRVDGGRGHYGVQAMPDKALDALRKHNAAREYVGALWPLIEAVCLYEQAPNEIMKSLGEDERTGIAFVRVGLRALGDFYGLPEDSNSEERRDG